MAKKIKFPLEMKDGVKVRTLEELRDHFDGEKLAAHFATGKLQSWLTDRHYEQKLKQLEEVDIKDENLLQKLCEVFAVEAVPADLELDEVLRRQELERDIRQYTEDEAILSQMEKIARDQGQLDQLLREEAPVIYLFGECFRLPGDMKDVQIAGINEPVLEIETDEAIDFKERGVEIRHCRFHEVYGILQEKKRMEEEKNQKKKRRIYQPSSVFDYLLSDGARKESEKLFDRIQDGLGDFEFDLGAGSRGIYKVMEQADIGGLFGIDRFGSGIKQKIEEADLPVVWAEFLDRIS